MAGVEMTHVPYKGAGAALTDLLAGQHPADVRNLRHRRCRRSRQDWCGRSAVSSAERIADLPDLPTIAESGYPDYRVSVWYGIAAPAKMPPEDVQTISASFDRALNDETFRASLTKVGFSAAAAAKRGGDQGVHRGRPRALVGRGQEAEILAGLEAMVRENEIREGELCCRSAAGRATPA